MAVCSIPKAAWLWSKLISTGLSGLPGRTNVGTGVTSLSLCCQSKGSESAGRSSGGGRGCGGNGGTTLALSRDTISSFCPTLLGDTERSLKSSQNLQKTEHRITHIHNMRDQEMVIYCNLLSLSVNSFLSFVNVKAGDVSLRAGKQCSNTDSFFCPVHCCCCCCCC